MNATPARNSYQSIMLLRLEREFHVDVEPAKDLSGTALDAWIESASDELFEREYAEFKAMNAAAAKQH